MGLILDSSVLVAAERQGQNAREMLTGVAAKTSDTEIAISVVTLMELAHGAARANTPDRQTKRRQFLDELQTALPIHAVTTTIALGAGEIDGRLQSRGIKIPISDLLIGVTALHLSFAVGTANVRHFRLIPGLTVLEI